MYAFHDNKKGSIEFIGGHWRAWRNGEGGGYISKTGGFTQKVKNAEEFSGPGVAIATARIFGFAITAW